jgi:hypothetical protein
MVGVVFLGLGIWCLVHAWRGIAPDLRPRFGFPEPGTRLRRSTRVIFAIGGLLLSALGAIILVRSSSSR